MPLRAQGISLPDFRGLLVHALYAGYSAGEVVPSIDAGAEGGSFSQNLTAPDR